MGYDPKVGVVVKDGVTYKPAMSDVLARYGWYWEMFDDGSGSFRNSSEDAAHYDMATREYRMCPGYANNTHWQFYEDGFADLKKKIEELIIKRSFGGFIAS